MYNQLFSRGQEAPASPLVFFSPSSGWRAEAGEPGAALHRGLRHGERHHLGAWQRLQELPGAQSFGRSQRTPKEADANRFLRAGEPQVLLALDAENSPVFSMGVLWGRRIKGSAK